MKNFSSLSEIGTLSRSDFEETCLANVDHLYVGDNTVMCKVLGRHKMMVDAKDLGIAPHLIMDGYWESWLTQLLARIIKPGAVCLDIGANFGYFSILMSELCGSAGKTISVEPNPSICSFLKATRFLNGGKFEIIESALADKRGEAVLTVTDRELGGGTIKPNDAAPNRSQVRVPTISVDELVEEKGLPRVDVIKMDVEGVEPLVFSGMKRTINNNPDIHILVEYSPSIYDDPAGFTDFLFSNFVVNRVKDVDTMTRLSSSDIPKLLAITDHTDLYLRRR